MVEGRDRLIKIAEVVEITSVSATSVRRMVAQNQFPKPVKVGDRSIRWWQSCVQGWVDNLKGAAP